MENNKNYYKKAGFLAKLLWRCCGAQIEVLESSTSKCRTRYSGLGGLVLATGVFASLAGGYAFYIIFQPPSLVSSEVLDVKTMIFATFGGICWGLMIFNIDRFIVVTSVSDGSEKITWGEFKSAIPRILMGFVIAITISKPLEIRLFKSEIESALHAEQQATKSNYANIVTKQNNEQRTALETSIKNYEDKINKFDGGITSQHNKAEEESKSGQKANFNLKYAEKNRLIAEKNQFISVNATQYNSDRVALNKLRTEITNETKQSVKIAAQSDGLGKRIDLAHQVGGQWKILFITLLFMVIELGPIFAKMMMKDGNYEKMLKEYEINGLISSGLVLDKIEIDNSVPIQERKFPLREENIRQLRQKITSIGIFFDRLHKNYAEDLLKKVDENYEQFIVKKDIKVDMMPNFGSDTAVDEKTKKAALENLSNNIDDVERTGPDFEEV